MSNPCGAADGLMERGERGGMGDILAAAIEEHRPVEIYALYSGGHDSLVSTRYAMENGAHKVLHVNTGVGIEATREVVRENCKRYGWPLKEVKPPQLNYLQLCAIWGVPGPGAHGFAYVWLKERAFDKVVREAKRRWNDRVMFVTGVRRLESARRMGHVEPVMRDGCSVWTAPMYDHSTDDQQDYMEEHSLPRNPVKDLLGMSGECLCGAYGNRDRELPIIRQLDPKCADLIEKAEKIAKNHNQPCVWGRARKSKSKKPKFMPACVNCEMEIEKAAWQRDVQP